MKNKLLILLIILLISCSQTDWPDHKSNWAKSMSEKSYNGLSKRLQVSMTGKLKTENVEDYFKINKSLYGCAYDILESDKWKLDRIDALILTEIERITMNVNNDDDRGYLAIEVFESCKEDYPHYPTDDEWDKLQGK
tara:strand:- start:405 stop:815 length:411 start_codon:yes stop_codon:yes gene_type:complete